MKRKQLENFTIIEDERNFSLENLLKLFNEEIPVYIVRNFLNKHLSNDIKNEFNKIIAETSGGNRQKDFVPVYQIGATQFEKSTQEYFDECQETREKIKRIIEAVSDDTVKEDFLLEKTLIDEFRRKNISFSPSIYNNRKVNEFTIRQWTNSENNGLALLPHEDLSQLSLAKVDNYEISNVKSVIACNLCISNNDNGGELLIWNVDPDIEEKRKLGVETSGYPYPLELLTDIESLKITINTGDLYFINANFIHAINEVQGNQRITLGRFMGSSQSDKIIYWT